MDPRRLGDPGEPGFRVEHYAFYRLNRAASRYNQAVAARLRPLDLDIPDWRVLMVLGEAEPRSMGALSAVAVIPISTMMRIVRRMEERGFVTVARRTSNADVTEVALDERGREKLEAARAATAPLYRAVVSRFTAAEYGGLLSLLDRLHDGLGEIAEAPG